MYRLSLRSDLKVQDRHGDDSPRVGQFVVNIVGRKTRKNKKQANRLAVRLLFRTFAQ